MDHVQRWLHGDQRCASGRSLLYIPLMMRGFTVNDNLWLGLSCLCSKHRLRFLFLNVFYSPQQYLRKDNVFRSVCQEFCLQGGCLPLGLGSVDTPRQTRVPPRRHPFPAGRQPLPSGRHSPDGHCSGWYASYWNAFLLKFIHKFIGRVIFKYFQVDFSLNL